MSVGFTGTRKGMTEAQKVQVQGLLEKLDDKWAHHGDCVGADFEFHQIAKTLDYKVMIHPPVNSKLRAFVEDYDAAMTVDNYHSRNRHIVSMSDRIIVAPKEPTEIMRSGTWSTYRFAKANGKKIYLVLPNGEVLEQ